MKARLSIFLLGLSALLWLNARAVAADPSADFKAANDL